MKKNIKKLLLISTLFITVSLTVSAQPYFIEDSFTETSSTVKKIIQTITAIVKVSKTNSGAIIYLKTKDAEYVADIDDSIPDSEEIINILKSRNHKKIIVSGTLNKNTGVFSVIKIGGIGNLSDK